MPKSFFDVRSYLQTPGLHQTFHRLMKTRFQIQIQFRSGELDVVHACEPLKKEKRGYHSEKKT